MIVLIDEYDVPLAKANENGYYDEMVLLIRNLFENVLKTNHSLKFAVLTGCLRVAKESIFTGLNNFKVYSITDVDFDENFGFTDDEVKELLHYYGQDFTKIDGTGLAGDIYDELTAKGTQCNLEEIEKDIEDRDYRDMHRETSPLKQAKDAVLVDSSEMNIDEVVDAIYQIYARV